MPLHSEACLWPIPPQPNTPLVCDTLTPTSQNTRAETVLSNMCAHQCVHIFVTAILAAHWRATSLHHVGVDQKHASMHSSFITLSALAREGDLSTSYDQALLVHQVPGSSMRQVGLIAHALTESERRQQTLAKRASVVATVAAAAATLGEWLLAAATHGATA